MHIIIDRPVSQNYPGINHNSAMIQLVVNNHLQAMNTIKPQSVQVNNAQNGVYQNLPNFPIIQPLNNITNKKENIIYNPPLQNLNQLQLISNNRPSAIIPVNNNIILNQYLTTMPPPNIALNLPSNQTNPLSIYPPNQQIILYPQANQLTVIQ